MLGANTEELPNSNESIGRGHNFGPVIEVRIQGTKYLSVPVVVSFMVAFLQLDHFNLYHLKKIIKQKIIRLK
jgi:hypothetical protein